MLFGGGLSHDIVATHPFWRGTMSLSSAVFSFVDEFETVDPFAWTYSGIASQALPFEYSGKGIAFTGRLNANTSSHRVLTRTAEAFSVPFAVEWSATTDDSGSSGEANCTSGVIAYVSASPASQWPSGELRVRGCTSTGHMCLEDVCAPVPRNRGSSRHWRLEVGVGEARLSAFDQAGELVATSSFSQGAIGELYFFLGADGPTTTSRTTVRWLAARMMVGSNFSSQPGAEWAGALEATGRAGVVQCEAPRDVSSSQEIDVEFAINAQGWQPAEAAQTLLAREPVLRNLEPSRISLDGGEVLTLSGDDFTSTSKSNSKLYDAVTAADGANLWVRVGRSPKIVASAVRNASRMLAAEAPSQLVGGLPPPLNASRTVHISADGQNFVDGTPITIESRERCNLLREDFDYIDNELVVTHTIRHGVHWANWARISGGNVSSSCTAGARDGVHVYQALTFDSLRASLSNPVREAQTQAQDTRLARANGTLEFSMRFVPGAGADACATEVTESAWTNASKVSLEFSTDDATHFTSMAEISPYGDLQLYAGTTTEIDQSELVDISERFVNFSLTIPLEACAQATSFRWIQHGTDAALAGWAIDSVVLRAIPTSDATIEVSEVRPRSGPIGGGTNVTISGDFTAAIEHGVNLRCTWYRSGSATRFPGPEGTAFARWNAAGIDSVDSVLLDASTLRCRTPPFYSSLRSDRVCAPEHKRVCADCCFLRLEVTGCGLRTEWREADAASASSLWSAARPAVDEFVYYEHLQLDKKYPASGGVSSSTQIRLTEVVARSTLFPTDDLKLRLTLRSSKSSHNITSVDVPGLIVNGLGLLSNFPQLGHAYGRRGLPFGCDAAAFRYQALYLWTELEPTYETAEEIRSLDNESYAQRCADANRKHADCDKADSRVGMIDRIQLRVKNAPPAGALLRDVRIAVYQQVELGKDTMRDLVLGVSGEDNGQFEFFDQNVEGGLLRDVFSRRVSPSFGATYTRGVDVRVAHEAGIANTTVFSDDQWVTFSLTEPFALEDGYNVVVELSQDYTASSADDAEGEGSCPRAAAGGASLAYHHVFEPRALRWHGVPSRTAHDATGAHYPFTADLPVAEPWTNFTFEFSVPMIQLCVYPDACPQRAMVLAEAGEHTFTSAQLRAADPVDGGGTDYAPHALAAVDLSLALNGADFIAVTGADLADPYYVYDDANLFFKPTSTSPLVGVVTGGTRVVLPVPAALPLLNAHEYFDATDSSAVIASSTRDKIVVRFEAVHGSFVELATGYLASPSLSANPWIECASPPLQAGPLRVRLAINGETFWPPVGGAADVDASDANCTFIPAGLTSPLGGYCVRAGCDDEGDGLPCGCRGSYHATGFDSTVRGCGACCVTESRFFTYDNFELSYRGGARGQPEYGPASGLNDDGSRVWVEAVPSGTIPSASYILEHLVCCFWLAPRTHDPIDNVIVEDDCIEPGCDDPASKWRDRVEHVEGLTVSNENGVCGRENARVEWLDTGQVYIKCYPPPLPVSTKDSHAWQLRVSFNGQDTHGVFVQNQRAISSLHGLEYVSLPCGAGSFATNYFGAKAARASARFSRLRCSCASRPQTNASRVRGVHTTIASLVRTGTNLMRPAMGATGSSTSTMHARKARSVRRAQKESIKAWRGHRVVTTAPRTQRTREMKCGPRRRLRAKSRWTRACVERVSIVMRARSRASNDPSRTLATSRVCAVLRALDQAVCATEAIAFMRHHRGRNG